MDEPTYGRTDLGSRDKMVVTTVVSVIAPIEC